MRLEHLAEMVIEAVEENESNLVLAERVRELVEWHKRDNAELEALAKALRVFYKG